MVFLQFLAGHLEKLRWRLSTPRQLKWSGVRRCPPSSTVRSEGTRCTMSGWLMGSPQDSQSSRTSWLMMPRYNTPQSHLTDTKYLSLTYTWATENYLELKVKHISITEQRQSDSLTVLSLTGCRSWTYDHIFWVVTDILCVYIFPPVISLCLDLIFVFFFSPYSYIIISGNMMIQLTMWVIKLEWKSNLLVSCCHPLHEWHVSFVHSELKSWFSNIRIHDWAF